MAFAGATLQAQSLLTTIDTIIYRPPLDRAIWGIVVEEADGTVQYSLNAGKLLIPASNGKLFSGATIAACHGFDARLETELWVDGEDVILKGAGDPSLGGRWTLTGDDLFAPFVDALRAQRITRVRHLIADVSLFDRVTIPYSWKVGNLIYDSAAPVDAIAYMENEPFNGFSTPSPPLLAASALRDSLWNAGIPVEEIRVNTSPREWSRKVATIRSPFVYQQLVTILSNSHNLYTEMLLKRIAKDGEPASYPRAFERELEFLTAEVGIDPADIQTMDASGLSPDNLVTPRAIIKMLRWMDRHREFWTLLAAPGADGTLRSRLTELATRLRGKTGTVSGVNALSGIVVGENGRRRYFSVIINHHTAGSSAATAAIDEVVRAIAAF